MEQPDGRPSGTGRVVAGGDRPRATLVDVLYATAVDFALRAVFPRRARRRPRLRRVVADVALNTTLLFAIRHWLIPYAKRMAQERERAVEELREELGREPTDAEVLARLGIT